MPKDYKKQLVMDATDEELLYELLTRNQLQQGPLKKVFVTSHHESVIGIGNDDVAYIQVDADSFRVLMQRTLEHNPGIGPEK